LYWGIGATRPRFDNLADGAVHRMIV
jgi:hypothetical protein